jgi:hypothetical protein
MSVTRSMTPPLPGQKPTVNGTEKQVPLPGRKPTVNTAEWQPPLPGHKPEATAAGTRNEVIDAIRSVSNVTGYSFAALVSQASRESGFDVSARNRKSTATGSFQFLERTWLSLVRQHGEEQGLGDMANQIKLVKGKPVVADPQMRKQILALRNDPQVSAKMAAIYLADSKERLSGVLKRPASEIEGRIAYIMGVNGAGRLIKAAENKPHTAARDLLPRAAAVNRNLFYDKSGRALSASDLVNQLANNLQKEDRRWNVLATDDSDDDEMDDVASNPNALLLAQQFGNETTG